MTPLEYRCDDLVTIRLCKKFESCIGDKPAYWYLKTPLFKSDRLFGHLKDAGFTVLYWNGERWDYHTPKQFPTPEEAFAEWTARIKKDKACQSILGT